MVSKALCTLSCLLILVPAVLCKAVPDEETREERSLESLMSSSLNHDLSHGLRKAPLSQRSRMDTLTGFGLGRSFDNDYAYYQIPPWMTRPYAQEMSKRNFDQIDAATGFKFSKRNFDQIDAGFGGFAKRNFDKLDRPGFGDFSKRR